MKKKKLLNVVFEIGLSHMKCCGVVGPIDETCCGVFLFIDLINF